MYHLIIFLDDETDNAKADNLSQALYAAMGIC